jgi:linoleoyl-CoA desaturase
MSGQLSIVKFAPKGPDSFYDVVKAKVNEYFEKNHISKYGNSTMYIKTVAMLCIYFVPYALIVSGLLSNMLWAYYCMWILMGIGIAGIGTSIMHDSNHGSYSKNESVNQLLGRLLNIIGGYSRNWRIQHNVLHHTYTNLEGLDEDIEAGILLRMSPNKKKYAIHKYQHIYAWILYGIMNIYWVVFKDFKCLITYHKNGLLKKEKVSFAQAMAELVFFKAVYFGYTLALPILFSGIAWQYVVIGFVVMHMIGGLLLACIFQLAHVMETSEYPVPNDNNKMANTWAVHQLLNTANFSPNSKFISWFIGGLNFQVEHHLFPHICHIHYPKISKIVKQVADQFDLPYHVQPSFAVALRMHASMLKNLGR